MLNQVPYLATKQRQEVQLLLEKAEKEKYPTSLYGAKTNWKMMKSPMMVGCVLKPKAVYSTVLLMRRPNTRKHRNVFTCQWKQINEMVKHLLVDEKTHSVRVIVLQSASSESQSLSLLPLRVLGSTEFCTTVTQTALVKWSKASSQVDYRGRQIQSPQNLTVWRFFSAPSFRGAGWSSG